METAGLNDWFETLINAADDRSFREQQMIADGAMVISRFERALRELKDRTLFIYGAGSFGREIFQMLCEHDITVSAFLDKNGSPDARLCGRPVCQANDASIDLCERASSVVLFSIVMDKKERLEVMDFLTACGYRELLEAQSIRCLLVRNENSRNGELDRDGLLSQKEPILRAARLFTDQESLETYAGTVMAHVSREYGSDLEKPLAEQYFPGDLRLLKGYRRFVDCGSYIGDTLEMLVAKRGPIEALAAFEPNLTNFKQLSKTAERLADDVESLFLYPCAVSEKTGTAALSSHGGSSVLSRTGDSPVVCVALDDVLKGFLPTFIKMDIEGEELSALAGAKNLIHRDRPDLAISVYHRINHIWDVPLLLDSWGLGYQFYVRSYNACTMETVLYATC